MVGAGFAGLYMLHRLRGLGLQVRVFEAGSGVGGTWYWNRYPGARCDVESLEYSYQFSHELQQEWEWTERYATQPEILRYVNHVADRFDLRRGITFDTRVDSASYDEESGMWEVRTDAEVVSSQFVIMATGCLSVTNTPDFPGLDSFSGPVYHTGHWPHEGVDFTGLRVGMIGTGSSAIQSTPIIAAEARHLTLFQRTANYSVPAHNRELDPDDVREIKADYENFRARNKLLPSGFGSREVEGVEREALKTPPEERDEIFERRWANGGLTFMGAFGDVLFDHQANDLVGDFVRGKIHQIVKDPETAKLLEPHYAIGCKRMCVDTGYYEAFNRSNVSLVDVSASPIEKITPGGVQVAGREYEMDSLILATGFDAMTGAIMRVDIRGPGGRTLAEKWAEGPRAYLGLQIAGFPNLFTITGPGSPSVLTNMLPSIEQHVDFIADCIQFMREKGTRRIEADLDAENAWVDHVNEMAGMTILSGCNSWYVGANIPGKPRVFMPYLGFPNYVDRCEQVVAAGYDGFRLS